MDKRIFSKVHKQSQFQFGSGEIVQNLFDMSLSEPFHSLGFHQNFIEYNEVCVIFVAQDYRFVLNFIFVLPSAGDLVLRTFKFDGILINRFVMTLPKVTVHFHAQSDHLK